MHFPGTKTPNSELYTVEAITVRDHRLALRHKPRHTYAIRSVLGWRYFFLREPHKLHFTSKRQCCKQKFATLRLLQILLALSSNHLRRCKLFLCCFWVFGGLLAGFLFERKARVLVAAG